MLRDVERCSYIDEIREGEVEGLVESNKLFAPGRIALINEMTHLKFQAKWVDCEELDRVEVSSRMIADHMADNVERAVRAIAEKTIDW